MATLIRLDDLYINLDQVTRIEVVLATPALVRIHFAAAADGESGGWVDSIELHGEQGARLLKWLDAGGRVSKVPPLTDPDNQLSNSEQKRQDDAVPF